MNSGLGASRPSVPDQPSETQTLDTNCARLSAVSGSDICMVRAERHQSQVSGALDGSGQAALVLCAHAGLSSRLDLVSVGDEPSEPVNFFIVDIVNMVHAEGTELSSRVVTGSPAAPSATRSSAGPTAESSATAWPATAGSSAKLRGWWPWTACG
jgi:hypothetical protein